MVKSDKKVAKSSNGWDFLEKQNVVHALSYFPYFVGPIAMFFLAKTDKNKAMHHIKYSAIIALVVVVLFFILKGFIANAVNLAYIAGSVYLAWKAYNGEEVNIEILDNIEDKISETVTKK